jgi:hypothetical protein
MASKTASKVVANVPTEFVNAFNAWILGMSKSKGKAVAWMDIEATLKQLHKNAKTQPTLDDIPPEIMKSIMASFSRTDVGNAKKTLRALANVPTTDHAEFVKYKAMVDKLVHHHTKKHRLWNEAENLANEIRIQHPSNRTFQKIAGDLEYARGNDLDYIVEVLNAAGESKVKMLSTIRDPSALGGNDLLVYLKYLQFNRKLVELSEEDHISQKWFDEFAADQKNIPFVKNRLHELLKPRKAASKSKSKSANTQ